MKKLKLYLETSVWSYYYAEDVQDKMESTRVFLEIVKPGNYDIYISNFVYGEINEAEDITVSRLTDLLKEYNPTELEITSEVYKLANKYIKAGILPRKAHSDAIHAAITSIYNLDALISWNCKHLANMVRRNKINSINMRYGYRTIDIFTPMEVMYL